MVSGPNRKGWTMNRYLVGMALALFLAGGEALAGQTAARLEFQSGRVGVSVAVGDLPYRVRPRPVTAAGWVAADWGRVRLWTGGHRPMLRREVLRRQDLRYLLGKETVRRMERHARNMGLAGPVEGRWFRGDRYNTFLEVTVRGIPVAELHDYGSDGIIDRVYLTDPHGGAWHSRVRPAPVLVAPQRVITKGPVARDRGMARYKEQPGKKGRKNRKKPW